MQSIQSLLNELKKQPNNYDLMVSAANAYFDIGRFEKAVTYYKKALTFKNESNVLIDLGVCYFNLNKLDSSLVFIQNVLNENPNHKQGLYNIGIVYYNLGNLNEAKNAWEFMVEKHPNSREADNARQFIEEINKQTSGI